MTDTITVTVHGVPLEVDFSYTPASKGSRDSLNGRAGCGGQLEPDEPEEVEIEEIRHEGCEIMCFFDDDSIARVRDAILEERGK